MQCRYKARHTELSDETKDYCHKRFEKFEKLLPESAYLEVEFIDEFGERGGLDKLVQVDLSVPGEKCTFHLEQSSPDWKESVDILQEKLEKEIKRWHEKRIDSSRYPRKYKAAENEERDSGEI